MENWTKEKLIAFEDDIVSLYKDCKLPFLFHLSGGNENQLLRIFKNIIPGDYVLSNHRGHYHALLHGMPPEVVRQRILDGRSMFLYDRERNYFTSAIIGGTPAIAAGIAWALKHRGSDQKVWCFVGDMSFYTGTIQESIRYSEVHDLPITFVIADNGVSVTTPTAACWGHSIKKLAEESSKCVYYSYTNVFPHAGIGEKVLF